MAMGAAALAIGYGVYQGISGYQAAQEQADNIRQQGQIQANEIQRQANATAEAQKAAARDMDRQSMSALMDADKQKFQADEELKQGEVLQEKANIEQLKGEREAAKRSRMLAQEIGSQYAQFAGNGFLVDANPTDTFGAIIRSSATEGQADISTILENAKMNQWTYEEQKRSMQRSAIGSLVGANNSVFKAQSLQAGAADARNAAALTQKNAAESAAETIAYSRSAARSAEKGGTRALWGGILGGVVKAAGTLYAGNVGGMQDWDFLG